jgi:hypothetical protein
MQYGYAANKRKGLPAPNAGTPSMQDAVIIYKSPMNVSFPYPRSTSQYYVLLSET